MNRQESINFGNHLRSMKDYSIVQRMMGQDHFSKWLGIEITENPASLPILKMQVRKEMLNGFGIAHGGITYALADSALAFASNCRGRHSVSIDTSISHVQKCEEGDVLTAETEEIHCGNKTGLYNIVIRNQQNQPVAYFKGTVYRKSKNWD